MADTKEKRARIRNIKDKTANWEKANPILLDGEIGIEIKPDGSIAIKIGDGETAWKLLKYVTKTMSEADAENQYLQDQINNIVVASSADGGDVSAEVAQARVSIDGTNFATLKDRLDADQNALAIEIGKVETDISLLKERYDADDTKHTENENTILDILNSSISKTSDLTLQYEKGTINLAVGIGNTVNLTPSTGVSFSYIIVPCKKGDTFTITGLGGSGPRLWGFTDSDYKLISSANAEANEEDLLLTASKNGYFISNVYSSNTTTYPYSLEFKHYVPVAEEIEDLNDEILAARTEAETSIYSILNSSILAESEKTSEYTKGVINLAVGVGNIVNPTPSASTKYSYYIHSCRKGDTYILTGLGGASARAWGFTDSEYKLLSVADAEARAENLTLVAEQDGYFISVVYSSNTTTYPYSLFFKYYLNVVNEIETVQEEIDELKYQKINVIQIRNRYYNAGSGVLTYYANFTCSQLIKVIPGTTVFIKTSAGDSVGVAGYNSEKVYNTRILETGGSALYPVERGVLTTKIIIPTNVYYITVSNIAPNNTDIEVTLPNDIAEMNEPAKMLIVPQSSLAFDVYVAASANKYLRHHFVKQYYSDTLIYGDDQTKEVVGADVWYSDVIADGATSVMAGNFNFIHNISNMSGHNGYVGAGHGCTVADWTIFYADGKSVAPDIISLPMACSRFDFQIKAKNYLIDKPNSPSESHAVPTLDADGNPIVTSVNIIDAKIREGNIIEYRNRLIFKMDGIQFSECHGSMCEGYFAAFDNVIISNSEESWNYIDSSDDYSREKMSDTQWDVFTAGSKKALSVTMFGDNYKVKNELYQVDGSRNPITNTRTALYRDNGARMKVYLMPVVCTISAENIADGTTVETFNTGDILDCISKREIIAL